VIAPGVRIVDVEPDGFGLLCSLVSTYERPSKGELHVLHENGTVQRAVHTISGPTPRHREPLGPDLPARARALYAEADVDRVVLVDRAALVAQAAEFAAAGPGELDQPTALRRSTQLFWTSPAVVTHPAPPSSASWERLAEHLRGLGDDYWGLLAGYDGSSCALTALARFVDGRVVHLTSMLPLLGERRPPAAEAHELVAAAESLGPVPFVLVADVDVLRSIGQATDLPAALAACAPQALLARGLPT
jgi:hypothetical protein